MTEFDRALNELADLKYPLFVRMHAEHRAVPMQIGIHKAVLAPVDVLRHSAIKRALRSLAGSIQYQSALRAEHAQRHDLDNHPVAPVSQHEREQARARLKLIQAKREEQRQASSKA
jgi:sRNA-binding protein